MTERLKMAKERAANPNPSNMFCAPNWAGAVDECNNNPDAVPCPGALPCPDGEECLAIGFGCTRATHKPTAAGAPPPADKMETKMEAKAAAAKKEEPAPEPEPEVELTEAQKMALERADIPNPSNFYCGGSYQESLNNCNEDPDAVPCPNNMPCPGGGFCFAVGMMCTP